MLPLFVFAWMLILAKPIRGQFTAMLVTPIRGKFTAVGDVFRSPFTTPTPPITSPLPKIPTQNTGTIDWFNDESRFMEVILTRQLDFTSGRRPNLGRKEIEELKEKLEADIRHPASLIPPGNQTNLIDQAVVVSSGLRSLCRSYNCNEEEVEEMQEFAEIGVDMKTGTFTTANAVDSNRATLSAIQGSPEAPTWMQVPALIFSIFSPNKISNEHF